MLLLLLGLAPRPTQWPTLGSKRCFTSVIGREMVRSLCCHQHVAIGAQWRCGTGYERPRGIQAVICSSAK